MKVPSRKSLTLVFMCLALAARSWAADPAAPAVKPPPPQGGPEVTLTPELTYVNVHGDRERFRADNWMKDDWTGGIGEFTLNQKLDKTTTLDMEGRGVFDQHDYKLKLEIVKPEVGFIRAGFTQYRKYSDDLGGFYKPFTRRAFDGKTDPGLDIGDIYVDVGLTLPKLPKLTLGYERQYRDGTESTLEWGSVSQSLTPTPPGQPSGTVTKKIYPAFKSIDETVDIFKANVEYDIKKVHLGDEFRFEHYRDSTGEHDADFNLTTSSTKTVTVKESQSHDDFSNVFHMESWLNEKVYWSAGYLFSTLHGDAGLRLNTRPYSAPLDKDWFTKDVDLESDSHVLNLNILVGPFKGLLGYAGIQAEKTETDGGADAMLTGFPDPVGTGPAADIKTANDTGSLEENVGLRFTSIPFTILYAEGRWVEQGIDLRERELENGSLTAGDAFQRFTDTDVFRQEYTVGFNTSPIRNLTWSGRYRYSKGENDYENEVDTTEGYSAFITGQEFRTHEVTTKVTVRPVSRLSLSFKYDLVATDIDTSTDPLPSLGTPKGTVHAGNYDANIYSASATYTPFARLYLTALFSLQDTRTVAFDNGANSVITYRGNVYTITGTAGYAIDNKTDLAVEYTYSRADDFKNNGFSNNPKAGSTSADFGLPLGVNNERHAATLTLARKFTKNVIGRLRYGYYELHDPGMGNRDNYQAHLASASCTVHF